MRIIATVFNILFSMAIWLVPAIWLGGGIVVLSWLPALFSFITIDEAIDDTFS